MDSSEIGRYGTISFMKRLEPDAVVAAFPIDEEEVTFGRDPKCSVRLYYKAVSPIHCKIIFEERKAFLGVLGVNGLIVDGCKVFPSLSSSKPTTIPLANNSDIEIHNKRFRFTYPPKELRAALLTTPSHLSSTRTPHSKRTLRMSMIHSAQVFSPRPSKDPRENLRILQSPLKPFRTPMKSTHQPEYDNDADEDFQEDEVVLVDGNHPRVVEEEKDLIIFEDVEVEDKEEEKTQTPPSYAVHTPGRKVAFKVPSNPSPRTPSPPQLAPHTGEPQSVALQAQPQTPTRRFPRPSLHRAVLIRSAQRAVMQAEMEKEDEEEEKEVEEFIAADVAVAERVSDESEGSDEGGDIMDETDENPATVQSTSTWGKKLAVTKLWPFGSASSPEGHDEDEDEGEGHVTHVDEGPTEDHITTAPTTEDQIQRGQAITPPPSNVRSLGKFMTPQVNRVEGKGRGRKSYAGPTFDRANGGGARRVVVEQAWRVKDIVLPEREAGGVKREDEGDTKDVLTWRGNGRARLSEEERKAIQERRRSALTTPDMFFGGQAPGTRNLSAFPGSPARTARPASPTTPGASKDKNEKDEEEALDTRSLLEKMKETVEGMKRRRSINPRLSISGGKMSLGLGISPRKMLAPEDEREVFSLLAPGVKEELTVLMQEKADEPMDVEDDKENTINLLEGEEGHKKSGFDEHDPEELEDGEYDGNSDHGVKTALVEPPRTPTRAPPVHPYETPRIDLRHMFVEPRVIATPSFTGVRDMFVHGNVRTVGTPAFEGMGGMMRTPEGYRYISNEEAKEDLDEGEDMEGEEGPTKESNRVKLTAASSHPRPATTKRKAPRAVSAETMAEDGSIIEEERGTVAKGRKERSNVRQSDGDGSTVVQTKARLLRGKKAVEDVIEQEPVTQTKTIRARKGKAENSEELSEPVDTLASKTKPLKQTSKSDEEVGQAPPSAPLRGAARRVRQTTNDSDVLNSEDSLLQSDPPSKPTRKTRTTRSQSQTPAESESDVSVPTTSKTTRKTRAKGTTQDTDDKPTTRTSGGRRNRTKPIEVDVDDDPLDTIDSPEHEMCQDIDNVPVTKVRRGARSRTTTVEAIKEEPEGTQSDMIDEQTRTGKGRKTAAKSSGSATRTSARTKKGASPVPASATSATSEDGFDKENAPDTVEDDEQVPEKVMKVKVTRSKKTSARVKEEKVTEAEGDPPARTRAGTRARK